MNVVQGPEKCHNNIKRNTLLVELSTLVQHLEEVPSVQFHDQVDTLLIFKGCMEFDNVGMGQLPMDPYFTVHTFSEQWTRAAVQKESVYQLDAVDEWSFND